MDDDVETTITTTREVLNEILMGETTVDDQLTDGGIKVEGTQGNLKEIQGMLDTFEFWFNIVTPQLVHMSGD